jgi:hypothetical protein
LASFGSTGEWINDSHAGIYEIGTASVSNCQTMDESGGRDEAILNRHCFSGPSKTRQQLRPFKTRVCVPGQMV